MTIPKTRQASLLPTLLLPAMLAGGCALAPGMHVDIENEAPESQAYRVMPVTAELMREQRISREQRVFDLQVEGLPAIDPNRADRDYHVGPGDVLTIVVWGVPELETSNSERRDPEDGVVVGPEGDIFFPYAGVMQVGGLTVEEIRTLLGEKLGVYVRSPQVDVRVGVYRSQRVQVTGEVLEPGAVALDNTSKGVLDALTERGGPSERASRRRVFLSRGNQRFEVNLDNLYGGDLGSFSPALQAGDVIRVPDASEDQIVVLGAVEAPKSVAMVSDKLSAISAIAAAGGVSKTTARGSDIYVFRAADSGMPEDEQIQVFQIDMSQPQGLLFATNFILQPRDVVYVATTELSRFNSVMVQLLPTLQEIFYVDRLTSDNR